jgi:hypothetical protein
MGLLAEGQQAKLLRAQQNMCLIKICIMFISAGPDETMNLQQKL